MRLIDADALREELDERSKYDTYSDYSMVLDTIALATTVKAEPVRNGKWVGVMTEEWCTFDECKCSVCGVVEYFNKGWKKFSYCPNCGARMDGEANG